MEINVKKINPVRCGNSRNGHRQTEKPPSVPAPNGFRYIPRRDIRIRIITISSCTGPSFYFDDIPTETIEAPDKGGDFIIGVNGDSMKLDYHDGDKLYVKKTEYISHGDVGIFTIGNECFLKEYGEDGLISRNKEYNDIPGSEDVRLIGKVIGKVEEN